MKKKFYGTIRVANDSSCGKNGFYVDYYILECKKSVKDCEKTFGVSAVKHYVDISGNNVVQEESVFRVSNSENEIYDFMLNLQNDEILPGMLCDYVNAKKTDKIIEKDAV